VAEVAEVEEDLTPEKLMQRMMGFTGFSTTQGKKADANKGTVADKGYVRKGTSARQYRQYMNRKGGFNRPLDAPKKTL
jgi:U4/U6.U5 tri-snRNP-associated protein 3